MTIAPLQRYVLFLASSYSAWKRRWIITPTFRRSMRQGESRDFPNVTVTSAAGKCRYDSPSHQDRSDLMQHTKQGWPAVYKKELEPFYKTKDELTIQDGCLMWGSRVLIPPKYQTQVLDELHDGHLGKAKMKALSRSYIWWPGIDKVIEQGSKGTGGQLPQHNPKIAPLHSWSGQHAPGSASALISRDHSWEQWF